MHNYIEKETTMPKPPIAFSWSRLECYEQCPRKFQLQNITKEMKTDFEAPHFAKGKMAHFLMEEHFKTGCDLKQTVYKVMGDNGKNFYSLKPGPSIVQSLDFDFRFLEKFCATMNKATQVLPEIQITFNSRMHEVSWFDKKAWCRIIIDLLVIVGDFAIAIDYKTGKVKPYSDQLKLFSGGIMSKYPQVKRVLSAYIWLDHPNQAPVWKEFTRKDLEDIWLEFGDRAELIQLSNESSNWPAKKNMFCKWCDASESQCEYK